MMTRALSLAALAAVTLSGCMTGPGYRCPVDGSGDPLECSSTERAYKASLRVRGDSGAHATSVFNAAQPPQGRPAGAPGEAGEAPFFTGQATNYPAPPGNGAPVFQQPRVFQPWLAPYVDGDGNMRSGEYGYFSTPGRWNYGTLRKSGSASGIFEPARPGDLGFVPVAKGAAPAQTARPVAPAEAPATRQAAPAAQQAPAPAAGSITQPYQRLQTE